MPREELRYCLRKSSIQETNVKVAQDMYNGSSTAVRNAVGMTKQFSAKVGLHQGLGEKNLLF